MVDLGEDTDTTGAVAGAVAGMWFGEEQIPVSWWDVTAKYDDIRKLSQRFGNVCLEHNE